MVVGPGVISNFRPFLVFLKSSFFRVLKALPVSPTTMAPFLRETRVSRKAIFPLHSVSMVNEIFVSIESVNVSWKAETSS